MTKTINDLIETLVSQQAGDLPQLDAQLILAHVLEKPRTWVAAHGDAPLAESQIDSAQNAFARLKAGEPLPYIIGHWEFFGFDFDVTRDVLIPRPETETLVEKAILWLQNSPERRPSASLRVADIGTGSGAIAVTLAMHVPEAYILATDISGAALKIAKHNAMKFHIHHRIDFLQCDLLPHPQPLSRWERGAVGGVRAFDLICANLPYIPTPTLQKLPVFGREPTLALDGGADGLDFYRRLLKIAPAWLAPGGLMLLEIEASQGSPALSLAYDSFEDVIIELHQDLAGHDRLLEIQLPG